MSISDQILAQHANLPKVDPGEFIQAKIDYVMVHEQLGGRIAPEFEKRGFDSIWDPEKIVYILDHWVPPPDVRAAKMHQRANAFAQKYHFKWNLGQNQGICHQVLPEKGFAQPGRLIVGSDSHTTTYGALNCFSTGIGASDVVSVFNSGELWFRVPETIRINFLGNLSSKVLGKDIILQLLGDFRTDGAIYQSFEFGGPGLSDISIDSRLTIANMVVEMGAKSGIFEGDTNLKQWLLDHPAPKLFPHESHPPKFVSPLPHYNYFKEKTLDLSSVEPMVALPYSPDNVKPVSEIDPIEIDQAFLGSCTNGRLEDLRIAAKIVKGHLIPAHVKFIVIPASREIYLQALKEGLIEIFVNAGGVVEYPNCGPCIGGHMGVLGPNEICVSSSNRNFKGRMGDPSSQTYLASSATVAYSAITGKICFDSL